MNENKEECLVCHAPLVYHQSQRMMECTRCGKMFLSNAECANGHYICDSCHGASAIRTISEFCLSSESKDPVEIAMGLMDLPDVHMHGPEHHVIIGSALLTAYANTAGGINLGSALEEMEKRGKQVPGGVCGLWGTCGAAVSCGMAYSIITRTTPLSGETWGLCNLMTSECLAAIGRIGGPRCCKRDGTTALTAASKFILDHNGVEISVPDRVVCRHSARNEQCIGDRCPYHPE